MNLKPSRIKRVKYGITCSKVCYAKRQETLMRGPGNHQFGLKGPLNASFKTGIKIHRQGYILVYKPEHPFAAYAEGYCRVHRLVVEAHYTHFPSEFFISIDGSMYLRQDLDVHHIDEDVLNNDVENLQVLSRSEHVRHHNRQKTLIRDNATGRIIGVIKRGELLGSPEVGNQQPSSVNSHKSNRKGSTTTE